MHFRSSGCCKVSPGGVGGSVTVKTKVPKLRIVKVTVVKPPLKDSGVALKRQWMGLRLNIGYHQSLYHIESHCPADKQNLMDNSQM